MAENLSDVPPPPPPPEPPEQDRLENAESDLRLEDADSAERRLPVDGTVQREDTTVPQPRLPDETPELQAQAAEQEKGAESTPPPENVTPGNIDADIKPDANDVEPGAPDADPEATPVQRQPEDTPELQNLATEQERESAVAENAERVEDERAAGDHRVEPAPELEASPSEPSTDDSAPDRVPSETGSEPVENVPESVVDSQLRSGGDATDQDAQPGSNEDETTQQAEPRAGVDRAVVEPDRYLVNPEDTEALKSKVALVGKENPADWIKEVNPRYETGGPEYENNCGDCSRAFATTVQTDRAVAAAGDRQQGELPEMWEWTDATPTNTVSEQDPAKLDEFQSVAWDRVAGQLENQPVGTVAMIGVDWEDQKIGNVSVSQGGHWFNAHVGQDGLKFADAQTGEYKDWPPQFDQRVKQIESVYRRPGESGWSS